MTFSTAEQTRDNAGVIADITVNPSQGGKLFPLSLLTALLRSEMVALLNSWREWH